MRDIHAFPRPVEDPPHQPVPDMRTWWQRNGAAVGVVIGSAMATFLAGTGGMTGLAHVAGIATVKENAALDAKIVAVAAAQQTAAGTEETRFLEINTKLDAMLKDARALRADVLKRAKKKTTGGASE